MIPTNLNPVGTLEVAHREVSASLNTLQHSLVIRKEPHLWGMRHESPPQLQTRTSNDTQRMASRNDFRLGG